MSSVTLDDIRPALEGIVPSMIATIGPDDMPNVAYLSQVYYAGPRHVALSFQFFNKTRRNILHHPHATLLLFHPQTYGAFRLHIHYLRTETEGPLFESMRAQLEGIASHSGMAGVYALRGSDIYEVQAIEAVPGASKPPPPPRSGLIGALRRCSEQLARSCTLENALAEAMHALSNDFGVEHAMILLLDDATQRLYTVASHGYTQSGVGSEIEIGQGLIGVAAQAKTPVRINHMTTAQIYSHALRDQAGTTPETEIPYPGLTEPQSQMAAPILSAGRVQGVLFVESTHDSRFTFEDEDALVAIAGHLGAAIELLRLEDEDENDDASDAPAPERQGSLQPLAATGATIKVRRYRSNNSIFLNGEYLIKGVAGAICWKLLSDYRHNGRTEHSNRELRLDASIGLPEVADNLEARLILLERRLAEQELPLRIRKTGRGRFEFCVGAKLELSEAD